jgi:hypothetical protein
MKVRKVHVRSWAFDEDRGRLMLFSGMTRPSNTFNTAVPADLWEWNPDANAWTLCSAGSPQPQARISGHMLFDASRHALLLMAGTGYDSTSTSVGAVHDLWEWAIP